MLLSIKLRQKVKIASAHRFSCETIKSRHPKTGSWLDANYCSNTMPKRGWDSKEVTWHLWRCDATFAAGWQILDVAGGCVSVRAGGTSAANPPRDTRMEKSTNWCNKGRVPHDNRGGNRPPLSWKRPKHSLRNRWRVQIESASVELEIIFKALILKIPLWTDPSIKCSLALLLCYLRVVWVSLSIQISHQSVSGLLKVCLLVSPLLLMQSFLWASELLA